MRKLSIIISAILMFITINGCVASPQAGLDIKMMLEKAEMHRKIASRNHVEFRFTKKYIKQGYKALKNNNYKKARQLANKALIQAKRAMIQKKISDKNWKLALPK